MKAPWAEPTGMVSITAQGFLGSEIPRPRNLSTQEFLGPGVPEKQQFTYGVVNIIKVFPFSAENSQKSENHRLEALNGPF